MIASPFERATARAQMISISGAMADFGISAGQ
jgi:hypothetical protein